MFLFLHYDKHTVYFYADESQSFLDIFGFLKKTMNVIIPYSSFIFCLELNQLIDTSTPLYETNLKNEYSLEVINANTIFFDW